MLCKTHHRQKMHKREKAREKNVYLVKLGSKVTACGF